MPTVNQYEVMIGQWGDHSGAGIVSAVDQGHVHDRCKVVHKQWSLGSAMANKNAQAFVRPASG